MKKLLLVWNLLLTLLLTGMVISGCSTLDPEFANLAAEVSNNRAIIDQLVSLSNKNEEAISANTQEIYLNKLTIQTLTSSTETTLNALGNSLTQYIQQYVQSYVPQVISSQSGE